MLAARLATAAALVAGLVAALFFLPQPWLAVLVGALIGLAAFEWARLCRLAGAIAWLYAFLVVALFAVLLVAGRGTWQVVFAAAFAFWLLVAPAWLWGGMNARHAKPLLAAGVAVLLPAALAMVAIPPQALLAVLVLVWVGDSAAFFVGRSWGRHKLAPAISPGKTWEGAAAGLLGALAYAIICGILIDGISWVPYLAAAILLAVGSVVGDLFESAAKRQAAVKDSGALLPGHGGVLDRIDSTAAVLPLAALLLPHVKAVP